MPRASIRPRLRPSIVSIVGYDERMPVDAVHFGTPSPTATIVLALGDPVDIGWHGEDTSDRRAGLAAGLHLTPTLIRTHGAQRGVHISLTPSGVRALLGMPASELACRMTDLDAVAPELSRCRARMQEMEDWDSRFALLQDALEAMLTSREPLDGVDPFVARCWDLLLASGGRMSIAALSGQTRTSRRTVSERFRRELGLSPKQVGRVMRFSHSHALWEVLTQSAATDHRIKVGASGRMLADSAQGSLEGSLRSPVSLADLAVICGYSDHAHLTREWRALSGQVPSAWETFPILQARHGEGPRS